MKIKGHTGSDPPTPGCFSSSCQGHTGGLRQEMQPHPEKPERSCTPQGPPRPTNNTRVQKSQDIAFRWDNSVGLVMLQSSPSGQLRSDCSPAPSLCPASSSTRPASSLLASPSSQQPFQNSTEHNPHPRLCFQGARPHPTLRALSVQWRNIPADIQTERKS